MPVPSRELVKRMTDVLDEGIPTMLVNDATSALIARIAKCILKAAGDGADEP